MRKRPVQREGGDNALLHAAMASMPYGFTIWDEEMCLVVYNQTYLEMYELPPDRVQPGLTLRGMAELNHTLGDLDGLPADEIHALYLRRFEGAEAGTVTEHRVRDRVIRSTVSRIPRLGWIGTHQDITEQVAAQQVTAAREAALARQNIWFHAAVNNMADGLAMFDSSHRLVVCNELFATMYGLPLDLVTPGTPIGDIIDYRLGNGFVQKGEDPHAQLTSRLETTRERGRSARFVEYERGRLIAVTHQPMADGGWVSTHQDITEQRRREDLIRARTLELEIQNIRFDAAISNMLHGLAMFDAENRLIVCNRQYTELYDLPEQLTRPGTSLWDMLAHGESTGMVSIADAETRYKTLTAVIEAGRQEKQNVKMQNGRVIAVLHQPMKGGGWISTHEDVTEQHRSEEHIRHLARHDALTDLPNRVLFREEMARIEARISRRETVALLLVDLDHFKDVNDKFGHAVGDGVLVTVARRLREASRDTDTLARLGGDEFAVLVGPLDNPKHAALIADRIVRSLGRAMTVEDYRITIGASVGIAVAPADGGDAESLLKNADLALYRAKNEGRGVYHFFERGMDDAMQHRRAVEASLKSAIANGDFRLLYQPLVGLPHNRIRCLEALLRWNHPERGLMPPLDFIAVAEETGLIVDIGEWVLREACRAARRWPEDIRVAVNLSAPQFRSRDLVESVRCALAEADLPGSRLELEITESLLFADSEATLDTLHRLRALGVRIVIDDFGAERTSLRHLRSFPFDKLKVDRALLQGLEGDGDPMAVVGAMIGLGKSLGIATAAESIETEEQLDRVRGHGCEEVQGFLFSPPLPASAIDALLGTVEASAAYRDLDLAGGAA
jgi:diguanylate cyclase (GGDEF)-like protein